MESNKFILKVDLPEFDLKAGQIIDQQITCLIFTDWVDDDQGNRL